jgi:hypothetical protein
MSVRFEYLYRDAGNFKNWGEVVFFNPLNINAVLAMAMAEKVVNRKQLCGSTTLRFAPITISKGVCTHGHSNLPL